MDHLRPTRRVPAAWALLLTACGGSLAGGAGGSPGTGGAVATGGSPSTGIRAATGGSSAGGSGGGGPTGAGAFAPGPWIDRSAGTQADGLNWQRLASDATGTRLVAVAAGGPNPLANANIWTSSDAGASWTNRTAGTQASGQHWIWVASDSSGAQLVAVTAVLMAGETNDVWTSSDAGATWIKRTSIDAGFVRGVVASDSTGARLALAVGDVWTSSDAGITWTDQTLASPAGLQDCYGVASDSSGDHLLAMTAVSGGSVDLWTSADAGKTWTNRTQATATSYQFWSGLASDNTGTFLVAVSQDSANQGMGDIWTSRDSGATWTNQTKGTAASGDQFSAVASDANGTNLVAAGGSGIWRSADSGVTWTNETIATSAYGQIWVSLAVDAGGSHFAAISNGGPVSSNVNGLCCIGSIWTRIPR